MKIYNWFISTFSPKTPDPSQDKTSTVQPGGDNKSLVAVGNKLRNDDVRIKFLKWASANPDAVKQDLTLRQIKYIADIIDKTKTARLPGLEKLAVKLYSLSLRFAPWIYFRTNDSINNSNTTSIFQQRVTKNTNALKGLPDLSPDKLEPEGTGGAKPSQIEKNTELEQTLDKLSNMGLKDDQELRYVKDHILTDQEKVEIVAELKKYSCGDLLKIFGSVGLAKGEKLQAFQTVLLEQIRKEWTPNPTPEAKKLLSFLITANFDHNDINLFREISTWCETHQVEKTDKEFKAELENLKKGYAIAEKTEKFLRAYDNIKTEGFKGVFKLSIDEATFKAMMTKKPGILEMERLTSLTDSAGKTLFHHPQGCKGKEPLVRWCLKQNLFLNESARRQNPFIMKDKNGQLPLQALYKSGGVEALKDIFRIIDEERTHEIEAIQNDIKRQDEGVAYWDRKYIETGETANLEMAKLCLETIKRFNQNLVNWNNLISDFTALQLNSILQNVTAKQGAELINALYKENSNYITSLSQETRRRLFAINNGDDGPISKFLSRRIS